ncbi:DUF2478 domain-containing protein (plasmid) [Paracoccus sp. TK19116]|uniref:DUF2478 domain-containing protein n=1 Tax=Paracoccus albicereus TaxID=2922394 RepID=A0ABT1MMC8_9RHOB|nr:DUF2478 domain-containing protein [Paracoccus albicereus]MCQ0969443.1 DUF2478 domain-containing protein [Paracoccus albicereus]
MSRLGWFSLPATAAPGESDRMLENLTIRLAAEGMRLAGAVQYNLDTRPDCACDMELQLTGSAGPRIRISQSLGPGSSGCRLDVGALETASGHVIAQLGRNPQLVILPKFGKQEAFGRGFCQPIAMALERDIPVLLHVAPEQLSAFTAFAGDLAERITPAGLAAWCRTVVATPA